MRCPVCASDASEGLHCRHCGAELSRLHASSRSTTARTPSRVALSFGILLVVIHVGAWFLLRAGMSFWHGLALVAGVGFLIGLLAGALRVVNPMDAEAVGEAVSIPSTLPGRSAPILLLAVLFGILATPLVGLGCYLVLAYARSCLDGRVVLIFALTMLSSLILSLASPAVVPVYLIYSRLMLPLVMIGWACSSFFRSDAW